MAKKTKEEFINQAKELHGDFYDYSLVDYTVMTDKVKIICPIHGLFEVQPRSHVKSECNKCAKLKMTTTFKEFVDKSNIIHKEKYTYDEKSYVNTNNKVNIFCKNHGWFKQTGHKHLRGQNCSKCVALTLGNNLKKTQGEFIMEAINMHGNKYGYDQVLYANAHSKISIWCSKCEKYFKQVAQNHLKYGCKACSDKNNGLLLRKTNEDFIKDVNKIHNNFYNYEKTKYTINYDIINVNCPLHGDFNIRASDHMNGCGCKSCGKEILKYNGWSDSAWVEFGNKSKNFIAFQVYIIKCFNNKTKESFYKIGKTYLEVKYRFSGKAIPYEYEIVKIITGEGKEMSVLERDLHSKYKLYKYRPLNPFRGQLECYNMDLPINEISAL